jgi:putative protein-disulfide isomerase
MQIIYVMDPMCAWCYGFAPELEKFLKNNPSIKIEYIMGGLAPDNTQPMDTELQQTISSYWYEIEKKTQVTFNHDFWKQNTPYRSTYPACRAVICAELLQEGSSLQMIKAIQSAYYQEAKNPSLEKTLIDCAKSIGLNEDKFLDIFQSNKTHQHLKQHLSLSKQLQARGFPALFYINRKNQAYPLTFGYTTVAILEERLEEIRKTP